MRLLGWGLGCVALVAACSPRTDAAATDDSANADAHRELLGHLAGAVVLPTVRDFDAAAAGLVEATTAWAAAPESASASAEAQDRWRAAMAVWQAAEVMQVGPGGAMGAVVGGEDLRDEIYSWPLVNPCRVDQEIVAKSFEDAAALAALPVNVRGLDALEYLLFHAGASNECRPTSGINTDGSWAAIDAAELTRRRATYAAAVAADVKTKAARLRSVWEPAEGDFAAKLGSAGKGGGPYRTAQEGLNAVSDAMFYVEKEVKDMKVAWPTGVAVTTLSACGEGICPEALESRWAHRSKDHILANLRAFRWIYVGSAAGEAAAPGFDDLLVGAGQEELAAGLLADLDAAIAAVEAIPGPLGEALTADLDAALAAYGALQKLADRLKTQFVGVLDLELPARAEGDND